MAVLDKLSIRGIRSFSPSEEEKISFAAPLTLFLGQNGCGKTTIIECINYALSNDVPGGSEAGKSGFINDPKLSNSHLTKGAVKLRFKDVKGDFVTVARFVEVNAMKGGKLTFKSLTSSVRWQDRQGNFGDIDGRCADIDLYCKEKLNVSKAILNNVIFCHQENSAWPLDEPKRVKDKFDEIFGSSEYNKILERFRKDIKDKKTNVKVYREQFETKRIVKLMTEKKKLELLNRETQLEANNATINEKEKELETLNVKFRKIIDLIENFNTINHKLVSLVTTNKGLAENEESLKQHLEKEFDGTDADLEKEIKNFGSNKNKIEEGIKSMDNKGNAIDTKIKGLQTSIQNQKIQLGQLEQKKTEYLKRCEEFQKLIDQSVVNLQIEKSNDEEIPETLNKLNTALGKKNEEFDSLQNALVNQDKLLQNGIDDLRVQLAAEQQNLNMKGNLIKQSEAKIKNIDMELANLESIKKQLSNIEKKKLALEEQLEKLKKSFNENAYLKEMEKLANEIKKHEENQYQLEKDHRLARENFVVNEKLESEGNSLEEKKFELNNLNNKHLENFKIIFGDDIPQIELEKSIINIQQNHEQFIKNTNKKISETERKAASLEALVKSENKQLVNLKNELEHDKKKVQDICKGKEFNEVIKETQIKREKLQKDKGLYESAKIFFEENIREFQQEKPTCPVCTTDFSKKKALIPTIISKLMKKIEDLPRKIVETNNGLKDTESYYNQLQQLKPVSDNIEILENVKIDLLVDAIRIKEEQLEKLKTEIKGLKNNLVNPQNILQICKITIPDSVRIDGLKDDLKKLERSIEDLNKQIVTFASTKSLIDIESELSEIRSDLKNLKATQKNHREKFDEMNQRIQSLTRTISVENNNRIEIEKKLLKESGLLKQKDEYKAVIEDCKKDLNKLQETTISLKESLKEAEINKRNEIAKFKTNVEKERKKLDVPKTLLADLMKLNRIIEECKKENYEAKSDTIKQELNDKNDNIEKLERTKTILVDATVKKREELADQEKILRSLKDNKELRSIRLKSENIQQEITKLKEEIGNNNNKALCEERTKLMKSINDIQLENNQKIGETNTIKGIIKTLKEELNKRECKNAEEEYRKKCYDLKIEELLIKDLEVYTEGLEMSIIKFHQEKMKQINITIRELWRQIYRGNDIDYVEICTDAKDPAVRRRRTYDYKVVQIKKGIALEMRGRCSAGQKVLASLVIRLALAETFSSNCGILALDEPTTNLDHENISSLSDALNNLIKLRERQQNFQLIIITHDEEFLKRIVRDHGISHFYCVQRNNDGFSEVRKKDF